LEQAFAVRSENESEVNWAVGMENWCTGNIQTVAPTSFSGRFLIYGNSSYGVDSVNGLTLPLGAGGQTAYGPEAACYLDVPIQKQTQWQNVGVLSGALGGDFSSISWNGECGVPPKFEPVAMRDLVIFV
jgi:hypothetical protein